MPGPTVVIKAFIPRAFRSKVSACSGKPPPAEILQGEKWKAQSRSAAAISFALPRFVVAMRRGVFPGSRRFSGRPSP